MSEKGSVEIIEIYDRPATDEENKWASNSIKKARRDIWLAWIIFGPAFIAFGLLPLLVFIIECGSRNKVEYYILVAAVFCGVGVFGLWKTRMSRIKLAIPDDNLVRTIRMPVRSASWIRRESLAEYGVQLNCAEDRVVTLLAAEDISVDGELLPSTFPGESIELLYYFRCPKQSKLIAQCQELNSKQLRQIGVRENGMLLGIRCAGEAKNVWIEFQSNLPFGHIIPLLRKPYIQSITGNEVIFEPARSREVMWGRICGNLRLSLNGNAL